MSKKSSKKSSSLPPVGTFIPNFPEGIHIAVAKKRLCEETGEKNDMKRQKGMTMEKIGKDYHAHFGKKMGGGEDDAKVKADVSRGGGGRGVVGG